MRIGLAIAPKEALPSAFVVFRDELEKSMEKAARLGYDGVELALLSASQVNTQRLRRALSANSLELPVISTGQVYADSRLWFTHTDPDVRKLAVARIIELIELAAEFGAMVNIGRVRGHIHEGETRETAEERFLGCIAACADRAEQVGVTMILEPVNRFEINYVNSVQEALRVLRRLGRTSVKLMPDTFHMNIEDVSLAGSIREAGDQLGYIHFADSNRLAPGQGHLDFAGIIAALVEIGYDGWATVEILPLPDPQRAAASAITYLRRLIPRHGMSSR